MLYVFVVIERGTRRLAYVNVTANPIETEFTRRSWTIRSKRLG
jgi:hypothetical protein